MTFGNNSLSLTYNPSSTKLSVPAGSGSSSTAARSDGRHEAAAFSLRFDTIDALAGVATGEGWEDTVGGGVKVAMADTWGKNRSVVRTPFSVQGEVRH
jgi:type 2A phosphatase activator TIP41